MILRRRPLRPREVVQIAVGTHLQVDRRVMPEAKVDAVVLPLDGSVG